MSRVLLINPDYFEDIFASSKMRAAISRGTIPLGLACLAAPLIQDGHDVSILNLNLADKRTDALMETLNNFRPQFVGVTATTPLIYKAYGIAERIKNFDEKIIVIAGGPHPSALPEDVLAESLIDCVVRGEGDLALKELVECGPNLSVPNLYYKDNGAIVQSQIQNQHIKDLDDLPFPAYELFVVKNYYQPGIASRKKPLGYLETSRGCYGTCIFCNKNIHGFKTRMKSPGRVVDEMERMLSLGFREIHIIDDIFTADMKRAYAICEEILRRKLNFPWYPRGGVRVDRVSPELLRIMKKAGCYRIPFGIESGSQRIIDIVKKRITIEQAESAVMMAKSAGMETECYFMIGLPNETEEEIKKSLALAIKLNPDYVKFAITVPLPGTPMFAEMEKNGQIKTKDWEKYNFSISPRELYDHDTLSWEVINKYYNQAHRKFYFRIAYVLRMIGHTLRNGTFLAHIKAFLQTKW